MNNDITKENWSHIRRAVSMRWEMFTDEDLDIVDGDRQSLIGKIQERYHVDRGNAQAQLEEFETILASKAA